MTSHYLSLSSDAAPREKKRRSDDKPQEVELPSGEFPRLQPVETDASKLQWRLQCLSNKWPSLSQGKREQILTTLDECIWDQEGLCVDLPRNSFWKIKPQLYGRRMETKRPTTLVLRPPVDLSIATSTAGAGSVEVKIDIEIATTIDYGQRLNNLPPIYAEERFRAELKLYGGEDFMQKLRLADKNLFWKLRDRQNKTDHKLKKWEADTVVSLLWIRGMPKPLLKIMLGYVQDIHSNVDEMLSYGNFIGRMHITSSYPPHQRVSHNAHSRRRRISDEPFKDRNATYLLYFPHQPKPKPSRLPAWPKIDLSIAIDRTSTSAGVVRPAIKPPPLSSVRMLDLDLQVSKNHRAGRESEQKYRSKFTRIDNSRTHHARSRTSKQSEFLQECERLDFEDYEYDYGYNCGYGYDSDYE